MDKEAALKSQKEYKQGLEAQAMAQVGILIFLSLSCFYLTNLFEQKQYAQDLLQHIEHCRQTREQERLRDNEVSYISNFASVSSMLLLF